MRVPRKLVISGDKEAGQQHVGFADTQLAILENDMRFRGLKQGHRTIRISQDIVVEVWSCFALQQVNIYVAPTGGKEEVEKKTSCFCNNCLSVGRILRINDGVILGAAPEERCGYEWDIYPSMYYGNEILTYDVELCISGNRYAEAINCLPSDHTPHCIGDIVLCYVQQLLGDPDTTAYDNCFNMLGMCSTGKCTNGTETAIFFRILPFVVPADLFNLTVSI
ncbi:MAG: hypothetical protein RBS34_00300 [Desulfofustis sp.]|jgi:hypothetical protein|nr:hypothetical protein [Desulfofustis sp.]